MRKTHFALLLSLAMVCLCLSGMAQEAAPERAVASYTYDVTEEGAYFENLIYPADVVINGECTQIVFVNCAFEGNIILTAAEATKVLLLGCEVQGACILDNQAVGVGLDYNNPKFLTDAPVTVVCENGAGSVVAMGDFAVTFNGESYAMANAQLFSDGSAPENGFVPYEGQESSYCIVAQYYENGEKTMLVLNEYDPGA